MAKKFSSVISNMFKSSHKDNPHYSRGWEESNFPTSKENKK